MLAGGAVLIIMALLYFLTTKKIKDTVEDEINNLNKSNKLRREKRKKLIQKEKKKRDVKMREIEEEYEYKRKELEHRENEHDQQQQQPMYDSDSYVDPVEFKKPVINEESDDDDMMDERYRQMQKAPTNGIMSRDLNDGTYF